VVGQVPRSKLVAELAPDDPRPRSRCRIRPTRGMPHEPACRDAALTNIRIVPLVERDARLCRAAHGTRDHAAVRAEARRRVRLRRACGEEAQPSRSISSRVSSAQRESSSA
jgi:hypothetical protein